MAKFWLEIHRESGIEKRDVKPEDAVGLVDGSCPGCCATPFYIQGGPVEIHARDVFRSGSRCVTCNATVGFVYGKVDTVFGLEEDARVLHGRARVYG